ncbi:methyl-accepting chemotaxis protein [Rossellomorea aquimaris]|uniref:methyl-accepting chemotaxis protein n=1 Tax=Rossellomorea aquimaris TaxID=189382 RepID=UPI003CEF7D6B
MLKSWQSKIGKREGAKTAFSFKSIRMKMILIFSSVFTIILIGLAVFLYFQQSEKIKEDVQKKSESIVKQIDFGINMFLEKYDSNIDILSNQALIADYLKGSASKEDEKSFDSKLLQTRVSNEFASFIRNNPAVTNIYVTGMNKKILIEPHANLPSDFNPLEAPWFKGASSNLEEPFWSEPYEDKSSGEFIVTLSKVVTEQNSSKVLGVIAFDIKIDQLNELVKSVNVDYNGYAFLFDQNAVAMVHPTEKGKNLMNLEFIKNMYDSSEESGILDYLFDKQERVLFYDTIEETNWKVGTVYINKNMLAEATDLRNTLLVITIIIILLISLITTLVARNITKPLIELNKQVSKVAHGDLTVSVQSTSDDEVGQLTKNFNSMVVSMREIIHSVQNSVTRVKESTENLSAISEETTASSEEIVRAMDEVANGATQAASDAEVGNQRTIDLSTQIEEVDEASNQLISLSNDASMTSENGLKQMINLKEKATRSNEVLHSVESVIENLTKKINEIDTVIHSINEISDQTNLLALNASIEAARAGEHGKGFAVVAEEVRKLAEQSARATNQVRHTIKDIQNESDHAKNEMKTTRAIADEQNIVVIETEKAFNSISLMIDNMVSSIQGISQKVEFMTSHKDDVVGAIQSISAAAQQSAAASEEVSASTEQQLTALNSINESASILNEASTNLADISNKFKV